jgi:hypothetical protein
MNFDLDDEVWGWTATQWRVCLRTRNGYAECCFGNFGEDLSATEAEIEVQMPVCELIVRYMYQKDIGAGSLDKAVQTIVYIS